MKGNRSNMNGMKATFLIALSVSIDVQYPKLDNGRDHRAGKEIILYQFDRQVWLRVHRFVIHRLSVGNEWIFHPNSNGSFEGLISRENWLWLERSFPMNSTCRYSHLPIIRRQSISKCTSCWSFGLRIDFVMVGHSEPPIVLVLARIRAVQNECVTMNSKVVAHPLV